jgi:HTH-type transcriptional regulator/antitoxin HigA
VDIALVRTLMRQHKLTGNDLPEIGDKTMVSKVLNEKRSLTRSAIEKLCARFGLRPSQFFGE